LGLRFRTHSSSAIFFGPTDVFAVICTNCHRDYGPNTCTNCGTYADRSADRCACLLLFVSVSNFRANCGAYTDKIADLSADCGTNICSNGHTKIIFCCFSDARSCM
jgi:hypothetical protein|tara:strand:- start:247 stop:564 length:318 start_codon:yes stop_codon:yes gene_type:complete